MNVVYVMDIANTVDVANVIHVVGVADIMENAATIKLNKYDTSADPKQQYILKLRNLHG